MPSPSLFPCLCGPCRRWVLVMTASREWKGHRWEGLLTNGEPPRDFRAVAVASGAALAHKLQDESCKWRRPCGRCSWPFACLRWGFRQLHIREVSTARAVTPTGGQASTTATVRRGHRRLCRHPGLPRRQRPWLPQGLAHRPVRGPAIRCPSVVRSAIAMRRGRTVRRRYIAEIRGTDGIWIGTTTASGVNPTRDGDRAKRQCPAGTS